MLVCTHLHQCEDENGRAGLHVPYHLRPSKARLETLHQKLILGPDTRIGMNGRCLRMGLLRQSASDCRGHNPWCRPVSCQL